MTHLGTDPRRSYTDTALLLVQPDNHRIEVDDDPQAIRERITQTQNPSFVVAVDASEKIVRVDLESVAQTLALRLGIDEDDAEPRRVELVAVGLPSGLSPVTVRITVRGSIAAIRATPLDHPHEHHERADLEVLKSTIIADIRRLIATETPADATAFLDAFGKLLDENSQRRLLAAQSALTLTTRRALVIDGRADPALLASLLEHRTNLRVIMAADSAGSERRPLSGEIASAIADTDALTQFVLSRQTLDLNLAAKAEAKLERAQEAEERSNQRRLERLASALLVPGLWLTFWSTKPAPDIEGAMGLVVVVGIAAAIAAVFWWIPWRGQSARSKND